MKKLVYFFVLIALTSCASKDKFDKESIVAACKKETAKAEETKGLMTDAQVHDICSCVADKALAQYKSASEMEKDDAGAEAIGTACAMEVMMPKTPDTPVNPMDTTTVPDTTQQ